MRLRRLRRPPLRRIKAAAVKSNPIPNNWKDGGTLAASTVLEKKVANFNADAEYKSNTTKRTNQVKTRSRVPVFRSPRVPEFPCSGVPVFRSSHVPEFPCSGVPVFRSPRVPESPCSGVPVFRSPRVPESPCSGVPVFRSRPTNLCDHLPVSSRIP
jgi:hypothetical protein